VRLSTVVSVLVYFAVVGVATFFLYSCARDFMIRPAHAGSMFFFNVGQGAGGGGGGGGGGCQGKLDLSAGCPLPPINGA
jgi:hypothetical protein